MAVYLGEEEIGSIVDLSIPAENLDTELTEQEELLTTLEADVNALEDKPKSDIQYMIDQTNSCANLFYKYNGTDLSFVKNLDTSNATSMKDMFYACTNLATVDLSHFNTSNVKDMSSMFYSCNKFTSLDLINFNTSKVTTMGDMFNSCSNLTSLDLSSFDTSKATTMSGMFYRCSSLPNIIGSIDCISAQYLSNMFANCTKLIDVTLKNIKKSLSLSQSKSLSDNSLINTFKELWDLTGQTSQTLTLSTTSKENIANIYVKLVDVTDEMLATDPNASNKKPCVVCESTDDGAMTLIEYATTQKNWAIA